MILTHKLKVESYQIICFEFLEENGQHISNIWQFLTVVMYFLCGQVGALCHNRAAHESLFPMVWTDFITLPGSPYRKPQINSMWTVLF